MLKQFLQLSLHRLRQLRPGSTRLALRYLLRSGKLHQNPGAPVRGSKLLLFTYNTSRGCSNMSELGWFPKAEGAEAASGRACIRGKSAD